MKNDEIQQALGKKFLIRGLHRCHFSQREVLYVKGFLPGRTVKVLQINPQADRLIVQVGNQKFVIKDVLWELFDLEVRD